MWKICSATFSLIFIFCSLSLTQAETYYIDFSTGADGNTGLSKSIAWKLHPYMNGFAGSYVHKSGDHFIFKGGVTWPASCFALSIKSGGVVGSPDYWGVDKTWFSGAAWKKPVFDGQNSALSRTQSIVSISSVSNITLDNFEIKGLLITTNSNFGMGSISVYDAANIAIRNCFVHDWTLASGVTHDDMFGGIIFNNPSTTKNGNVVDSCVITDSAAGGNSGFGVRCADTLKNSVIHHVPNGALGSFRFVYGNVIHDIGGSFDPAQHENALYVFNWNNAAGPAYIYNNVIYKSEEMSLYVAPGWNMGGTIGIAYIFNNIVVNSLHGIEIDPENATAQTTMYIYAYNNTVEGTFRVTPRGGTPVTELILKNNHFINDVAENPAWYNRTSAGTVTKVIDSNNLAMTHTVATAQGFSAANFYMPMSATVGTVDKGVDVSSKFLTDIRGVARPSGRAWDIGAFEFSTTTGTTMKISPKPIVPPKKKRTSVLINQGTIKPSFRNKSDDVYSLFGSKYTNKNLQGSAVSGLLIAKAGRDNAGYRIAIIR